MDLFNSVESNEYFLNQFATSMIGSVKPPNGAIALWTSTVNYEVYNEGNIPYLTVKRSHQMDIGLK